MKYTELQKTLTILKNQGTQVLCDIRASREKLETEYKRILSGAIVLPASDPKIIKVDSRETQITVLAVNNDNTITTGINSEHHIIKVYWDEERDTAISINREVVIKNHQNTLTDRDSDTCKIEYIGNGVGGYRAFPMSTVKGYCEWVYPGENTRYHSIKARISHHDSHYKIVSASSEKQQPTIITSDDICIVRMYDDVRCGITRYFPAIATFELIGKRWLLMDAKPQNVAWISIVQAVKKVHLPIGEMVYLQNDIGTVGKIDVYRIDKIFYAHLCLMAHCTNIRTNDAAIVPLVQLHLPKTLR